MSIPDGTAPRRAALTILAAALAACATAFAAAPSVSLKVEPEHPVPGAPFRLRAEVSFPSRPDPRSLYKISGLPFAPEMIPSGNVRVSGAQETVDALQNANAGGEAVNIAFQGIDRNDPFSIRPRPAVFRLPLEKGKDASGGDAWILAVESPVLRAKTAGTFEMPRVSVSLAVSQDVFGEINFRRESIAPAVSAEVRPAPAEGRPEGWTGYAGTDFSVSAAPDAQSCRMGDLINLNVTIETDDPPGVSAPDLSSQSTEFFKIGAEPVKTETQGRAVKYSYEIRPVKAGAAEFPALSFGWYDASRNAYAVKTSAPVPVQIAEAPVAVLADDYPMPDGMRFADADGSSAGTPLMPRPRTLWLLFLLPPGAFLLALAAPGASAKFRAIRAGIAGAGALPRALKKIRTGSPSAGKAVSAYFRIVHSRTGETVTAAEAEKIMTGAGERRDATDTVVKFLSAAETAAFSRRARR